MDLPITHLLSSPELVYVWAAMRDTMQARVTRQSSYGVIALILGLMLCGCSTTKGLERAREAAPDAGDVVEVSSPLAELAQTLPEAMRSLGYQDISLEPSAGGSFTLYAATPATGASFGHAVRMKASSASGSNDVSVIALVLVRRVRLNESEDLDAARARLMSALTQRYP